MSGIYPFNCNILPDSDFLEEPHTLLDGASMVTEENQVSLNSLENRDAVPFESDATSDATIPQPQHVTLVFEINFDKERPENNESEINVIIVSPTNNESSISFQEVLPVPKVLAKKAKGNGNNS